jgi:hypothetical protein
MNQAQKRMAWLVVPMLGLFAWGLYSMPAAPPPPPTPLLEVLIPGVMWTALVFGDRLFGHRNPWGPWRQVGRTTRTGLVFLTIQIVSPWWSPQVATPGIYIGFGLLAAGMWIEAKDDPTDTATLTRSRQPS